MSQPTTSSDAQLRADPPQLSVVISTYNRGPLLADAVRSVLAQRTDGPSFELIVVDNNSTDDTRATVQSLIEGDRRVRYVFEPRQGVSHGRNAGIAAARAPIVAFTDDDVRAQPDWTSVIRQAFEDHPWADFVGGRVLPRWPGPVPRWLTPEHWAPLALVDYGAEPLRVDLDRPICMLTCNVAYRRATLARTGAFDPRFQHRPGARSACEDWELQLRVMRAGGAGLYLPSMVMEADVQPNRLDRRYHRQWHLDHGRAVTDLLGPNQMFDSRGVPVPRPPGSRTLLGASPWIYREVLTGSWAAAVALCTGRRDVAFTAECRVREALGLLAGSRERWRDRATPGIAAGNAAEGS